MRSISFPSRASFSGVKGLGHGMTAVSRELGCVQRVFAKLRRKLESVGKILRRKCFRQLLRGIANSDQGEAPPV